VDGERVHATRKFARQRCIDQSVAFEPALTAEGFRYDIESEMSRAARPVAGMAFVPMGFVLDAQTFGREGLAQLFGDKFLRSHLP